MSAALRLPDNVFGIGTRLAVVLAAAALLACARRPPDEAISITCGGIGTQADLCRRGVEAWWPLAPSSALCTMCFSMPSRVPHGRRASNTIRRPASSGMPVAP